MFSVNKCHPDFFPPFRNVHWCNSSLSIQVVSSAPARADKTQSVSPVWVAISLVVACVAGIITGGAAALRKLGMSQSSFVCWHFHPDDDKNINKSMATFQLKTFRPACVSFWQLVSAKVERSAYLEATHWPTSEGIRTIGRRREQVDKQRGDGGACEKKNRGCAGVGATLV